MDTGSVARGLAALAASSMRLSCSKAFSHTPRASGSATSCEAFSTAGMRCGRKGAASSGSSTSLDMFEVITEHWRLMVALRSL